MAEVAVADVSCRAGCYCYIACFSSRRRHTRCALVTEFRRVLFRSPLLAVELVLPVTRLQADDLDRHARHETLGESGLRHGHLVEEIGRASCRERVCQYV